MRNVVTMVTDHVLIVSMVTKIILMYEVPNIIAPIGNIEIIFELENGF